MLHEMIKNTAIRMQSADNVLFGENKKAHPLGVGGMSIDMAEDRLLMQLNAPYDDATNITIYTESVRKTLKSYINTVTSTDVSGLYKESKLKGMLSKVWQWFKKIAKYIADIPKRTLNYFKKKFGKKKDVAKTKPSESTAAIKEKFLLAYDATVSEKELASARKAKDIETISHMIDDGLRAGVDAISSNSSNYIKYSSAELKKLASMAVAIAHASPKPDDVKFDKELYESVKGTEYEIPFITSMVALLIVQSGEIPYMPYKVEEYMTSLGVKKGFFDESIFDVSRIHPSGGSISHNLIRAMGQVYDHLNKVVPVVSSTEWGKSVLSLKLDMLSVPDDIVAVAEELCKRVELIGDVSSYTNDNILVEMSKHAGVMADCSSKLLPFATHPDKFIRRVTLKDLISDDSPANKDYSAIIDILEMHHALQDLSNPEKMNEMVLEGIEHNRNLTEDTMVKTFNILIAALKDIPAIATGVNKVVIKMISSAFAVEEELVGFFGTTSNMDNVPLTAIAATVAHDLRLRDAVLRAVGYI